MRVRSGSKFALAHCQPLRRELLLVTHSARLGLLFPGHGSAARRSYGGDVGSLARSRGAIAASFLPAVAWIESCFQGSKSERHGCV